MKARDISITPSAGRLRNLVGVPQRATGRGQVPNNDRDCSSPSPPKFTCLANIEFHGPKRHVGSNMHLCRCVLVLSSGSMSCHPTPWLRANFTSDPLEYIAQARGDQFNIYSSMVQPRQVCGFRGRGISSDVCFPRARAPYQVEFMGNQRGDLPNSATMLVPKHREWPLSM